MGFQISISFSSPPHPCDNTKLPPPLQVLERALRAASSQFNTHSSNPTIGFVRLSGALHCDERSAFQEIAHQLCR